MNIRLLKSHIKFKQLYFSLGSILFSLFLINVVSGLKILIPSETNWLSIGDGTSEISWEFFRREPLFQFPFGKNPNYGLEISSTIAFDGQIPLLSIFFKLFNFLLPDRFQYFGIFIFLTFALNFYFACRIFQLLGFNNVQITLNSILISMSPIILNRFIENTHYALTSVWLIFWAIYLALQKKNNFLSWLSIFILVILIHFYFMPFILVIYFLFKFNQIRIKKINLYTSLLQSIIIFFSTVVSMILIGYFYNQSSSQDIGFGIYRSTLTSLIDPNGWSMTIPDLKEPNGAYEGFSFIGISSLILLATYLITKNRRDQKQHLEFQNFNILWISALILYVFSLSNKISFGSVELFEYPVPSYLEILTNSFRSSGRFSWLIVFVLFIYLTFKVSFKFSARNYSVFLVILISVNLIDSYNQLTSQKESKFNQVHSTLLIDSSWNDIGKCYKKIRFFPPVASIDNLYDFLLLANSQNLGINSARLARFNQLVQNEEINSLRNIIENGSYEKDSFYIFNTSPFVDENFVKLYKELSIRTLSANDAWGIIDNYQFIAPNLTNCSVENEVMKKVIGFGAESRYLYGGENLIFGTRQNNDKYSLLGFGEIFNSGVTTNISKSIIILNPIRNYNPTEVKLEVTKLDSQKELGNIFISINNSSPKRCNFNLNLDFCTLKINEKLKDTIIRIEFVSLSNPFILNSLKMI